MFALPAVCVPLHLGSWPAAENISSISWWAIGGPPDIAKVCAIFQEMLGNLLKDFKISSAFWARDIPPLECGYGVKGFDPGFQMLAVFEDRS